MKNVTIEKTSKHLKLHLILANSLLVIAAIWAICIYYNADAQNVRQSFTNPAILAVMSGVWSLITRFRIWWNHG